MIRDPRKGVPLAVSLYGREVATMRKTGLVLTRPGVREIIFRDGSNLVAEIYTGQPRPRYCVREFGTAERAQMMLRHLAKFAKELKRDDQSR